MSDIPFRPMADTLTREQREADPPIVKLGTAYLIGDTLADARMLAETMGWDLRALEYVVEQFATKLKRSNPKFHRVHFLQNYRDDTGAAIRPLRSDAQTVEGPDGRTSIRIMSKRT